MQRFLNDPEQVVDDMIDGFVKANEHTVERSDKNDRVIKLKNTSQKGKVAIVTGGGSGHEPTFLGYLGKNMVDVVAVGEVFASPPADAFYDAFIEADSGAGVACLFGNYAGDTMNVKMAIQMAEDEGIDVKYVTAKDDIASATKENKLKRHGMAGGVFMWKAAGAKADMGGALDEVLRVAEKTVDQTRSICVGLSSCTIPAVGHPNFTIEEGTMEFGIGHHGEPGIKVEKLKTATEIATEMTEALLADFSFNGQENLAVLLSGLGRTPTMELYILYRTIEQVLTEKGHKIDVAFIGDYATSLDMNGVSLTLMRLDDELKQLLAYEADTCGLKVVKAPQ